MCFKGGNFYNNSVSSTLYILHVGTKGVRIESLSFEKPDPDPAPPAHLEFNPYPFSLTLLKLMPSPSPGSSQPGLPVSSYNQVLLWTIERLAAVAQQVGLAYDFSTLSEFVSSATVEFQSSAPLDST